MIKKELLSQLTLIMKLKNIYLKYKKKLARQEIIVK